MQRQPIPVVVGPGTLLVAIDHHHTLAALDQSGYDSTDVTINIVCNLSYLTEDTCWIEMERRNFLYLLAHPGDPNVLPVPINVTALPTKIRFSKDGSVFQDDPWRSVVGFLEDVASDTCPSHNE